MSFNSISDVFDKIIELTRSLSNMQLRIALIAVNYVN